MGGLAAAAPQRAPSHPSWPCSDRPPSAPDTSWLWPGAKFDPSWRNDTAIASLVASIAPRRLPEGDASSRIKEFAVARPDKGLAMARLASGLIDTIGAEQRLVIDGMERFNARQAVLAARIEAAYARLPAVDEASAALQPDMAALQEQVRWDTRIFEDRQRLLPVMCRVPGMLSARLGILLAAAQDGVGAKTPSAYYRVYVTNERTGDISIIDPASRVEIGRIPVGKRPRGLVASPDYKLLYVALSGSPIGGPDVDESRLPPPDEAADGIAVIDIASGKIVRTLRGVSDPEQLAINAKGDRLYVSSEDSGQMIILDVQGGIIARVDVGGEPEGVAISPDGTVVLATSEADNSVAVIRGGDQPKLVSHIKVGERPRNIAFLPDGQALIPGEFDSSLTLIDYMRSRVVRTIRLGSEDRPMGIQTGSDGFVYLTTGRGGKLVKISPFQPEQPTRSAFVGARPWGITLSPDGKTAFTANGSSDDVTFVDTSTMRIIGKISVRGGPWGVLAIRSPVN